MKRHLLAIIAAAYIMAPLSALCQPVPPGHPPAAASETPQKTEDSRLPELSGKVLQTMNSGGYSYVYIQRKNGTKVWVAILETQIKVGSQISFKPGMEMENFESSTLKRTFDRIIFSDGMIQAPQKAAPQKNAKKGDPNASLSQGSKGATVKTKEVSVKTGKAEGPNAYTVEDVYAKASQLKNKKVSVKGKIVKVSAQIMERNWVHIQDGTGSASKGNHNLVFTTLDLPTVGDIVTASGVLSKDKDFGGGYKYPVIVEGSSIKKQK